MQGDENGGAIPRVSSRANSASVKCRPAVGAADGAFLCGHRSSGNPPGHAHPPRVCRRYRAAAGVPRGGRWRWPRRGRDRRGRNRSRRRRPRAFPAIVASSRAASQTGPALSDPKTRRSPCLELFGRAGERRASARRSSRLCSMISTPATISPRTRFRIQAGGMTRVSLRTSHVTGCKQDRGRSRTLRVAQLRGVIRAHDEHASGPSRGSTGAQGRSGPRAV